MGTVNKIKINGVSRDLRDADAQSKISDLASETEQLSADNATNKTALQLITSLLKDAVYTKDRSATILTLVAVVFGGASAICGDCTCGQMICGL